MSEVGYKKPPRDKRFKKGQSGNSSGRPKGALNISTLTKKLAADPKLAQKMLTKEPSWWNNLEDKNMASAIVGAMLIQAASGDTKAATWIRKTGWGDKLDITSDGEPVQYATIVKLDK